MKPSPGSWRFRTLCVSTFRNYTLIVTAPDMGTITQPVSVSSQNLILTAVISLVVLGSVALLYRPFLVISFDPVLATTLRFPRELLRNLPLVLLALTIVVSLQTVGIGLVAAMLVTPAATAYLVTRRLPAMMAVSALVGALSSLIGLYLSYYANIASGAAVVLAATFFFLLAFFFAPGRGVLRQARGQHA